jgi:hypothetical protein
MLNWLGIQDAARKRRDASQRTGPWSGSVFRASEKGVVVLSDEEKWRKSKVLLQEVLVLLEEDPKNLPRKRLEQFRGFLGYVTRTYPCMVPYLKGLHLTIDGWRKTCDERRWRLALSELRLRSEATALDEDEDGEEEDSVPPVVLLVMPHLESDMQALLSLIMSADKPVLRPTRCHKTSKAYYGFGDASGLGFGATIQIGDSIWYEYGQWSEEVVEERSSNWREFTNLVEFLERSVKEHKLGGSEISIFTDNNTLEATFWKGTSSSPLLFDLVLRLRKLEMDSNLIIHVLHISGKRMIDQGTDGLSRADHSQGAVTGRDIRHWVPLNESAFAGSKGLEAWLGKALRGLDFTTLSPEGWFTIGHEYGNHVWVPPPAACDVAVEQLGKARLKRPESAHLIVVPRLMTG